LLTEYNAFDSIPWINKLVEFTKQVLAQDRVRIIGVCFGHQIVGRALGADVGRNDVGWEISVCEVDLTERGKELFQRGKLVSYDPFSYFDTFNYQKLYVHII
jgi:GMP synthase-like glutamine amidotransferase